MKTKIINLFEFSKLSEKYKETAIKNYYSAEDYDY